MTFKMNEKDTIQKALLLANINYDDITFHTNGKVTISRQVTDDETLALAEVGIFTSLKNDAVTIWDTLGVSKSFSHSDIEFYITWQDGQAFAKFEIYPDLERTAYNSVERIAKAEGINWDIDRDEALLEVAIEVEESLEKVETIITVVKKVIEKHYIGFSKKCALRQFVRDLFRVFDMNPPLALKFSNLY